MIVLRPAMPGDAAALGALHHRVWSLTYAALAPEEARRALTAERRIAAWRGILAGPEGAGLELADGPAGLCGFCLVSEAGAVPEIAHLYVAPEVQGQGLGRRLLGSALARLAARGHERAVLDCVAGNEAALGFYRAMGGEVTGRRLSPGPLWRSDNLVIEVPCR